MKKLVLVLVLLFAIPAQAELLPRSIADEIGTRIKSMLDADLCAKDDCAVSR